MKLEHVRSIIDGNIQAIDQGIAVIESLTDHQYCQTASPYVNSTIGQHFRHVVDIFLALVDRPQRDTIDYDVRRRGCEIETDRGAALSIMRRLRHWMQTRLDDPVHLLQGQLHIKTEVTITETHAVSLPSSLLRELVFSSSHAVHHYALISVIAKHQSLDLDRSFGIAPATATFLRADDEPVDDASACAP